MKLYEIIETIENALPKKYAMSWDNVGLMIGSLEKDIQKVMITLDVTEEVVGFAIDSKCDLIVSHHPMFFDEVKSINYDCALGRIIKDLIKNDICVYSCHTNMDVAECGINAALANLFELEESVVLKPLPDNENVGIGRIGKLKESMGVDDFLIKTKKLLSTDCLKVVKPDFQKNIKTVCVAGGSCGDLIMIAKDKGADVIITADVKYHQALDASQRDICVIDAGHFQTEIVFCDIMKKLLKPIGLELVVSKQKDCFEFI